MSAYHVSIHEPHRVRNVANTELGRRAVQWLTWSIGLLFAAFIDTVLWLMSWFATPADTTPLFYLAVLLFVAAESLGLAAGGAALVAIARRGERAFIVYAAFLPTICTLLWVVNGVFGTGSG